MRSLGLVFAVALVGLGGCSGSSSEVLGPFLPYLGPPTPEDSIVVPVATGGPVDVMTDGLTSAGFFCAQVRANAHARQIWCRATKEGPPDTETVWVSTVDIVATPAGEVQYVRVDPPEEAGRNTARTVDYTDADDNLNMILSASVLLLWPEDTEVVGALIDTVRHPWEWFPKGNDPRPARQQNASTKHADYFVGEGDVFSEEILTTGRSPLTFIATTEHFSADKWPVSSTHALPVAAAAAPSLEAAGFECWNEASDMSCVREGGYEQVNYSTAPDSDEVAMVRAFIGGGTNDDGDFATLADQGFPQGLTFLGQAVRPAIETRLDQARHDGASFAGIIEGTVVVIDIPPEYGNLDDPIAAPVTMTLGAPLVKGPVDRDR